jgi:hypothetical protein
MLSVGGVTDERIGTAHRAKLAFIYIRQSTADQVRQHPPVSQELSRV